MSCPPTPPPDRIDLNDIANPADDSIDAISLPIALFAIDVAVALSIAATQLLLLPARSAKSIAAAASPPRSKRPATSLSRSSPCRSAFHTFVCVAASFLDGQNQVLLRVSPPSVLQSVFDDPPPPPPSDNVCQSKQSKKEAKKGRSCTMLGLIPKTEFLHESCSRFSTKTNISPSQITKDLKAKRK